MLLFRIIRYLILSKLASYFSEPNKVKYSEKSSTFVLKLFKLVETLVSLVIFSLSTSALKAIRSFLAAKSDVSMLQALI